MLRFAVAAPQHAQLLAFIRKATPYYEQPGGIRIRLLQRLSAPDEFVEIVEYADLEAFQRDQLRVESDPQMKALLQEWRGLHVGPLSMDVYHERPIEPAGDSARA